MNNLSYVFNGIYKDELLIKYTNELSASERYIEIVRKDLFIEPIYTDTDVKDEIYKIDGINPILSDGDVILIRLESGSIGIEAMVLNKGEEIRGEEIIVRDNYDNVLMIERIEDEVNLNKAGEYKLGYKVVDSSGNETIIYKDVIVKDVETSNVVLYVVEIVLSAIILGFASVMLMKRKY